MAKPTRQVGRVGIVVDLRKNTVDGKKVMPCVAELVYCLVEHPGIGVRDLISKLYGPCGPEDANNALKQTAHQARKVGIRVVFVGPRRTGRYTLADTVEEFT